MDNQIAKSNPLVAIIIINYNGFEDTMECLESLSKITYGNYKVIIVDNASKDNEVIKIRNAFSQHKYIQTSQNKGFSGANNIGIEYALSINADYILLLNNDTTVEPDFLEPLIISFSKTNNVGMVTPQICFYKYPDTVWMSGGRLSKMMGTGFRLKSEKQLRRLNESEEITFISGCCALIKSEILKTVGLWDEKYFLYVEDVDYSFRMKNAGFTMLLIHGSVIYHKINASTVKKNINLPVYYGVRNRLLFSWLHFDLWSIIAIVYILSSTLTKEFVWFFTDREKYNYANNAINDFFKGKYGKK